MSLMEKGTYLGQVSELRGEEKNDQTQGNVRVQQIEEVEGVSGMSPLLYE